MSSRIGQEATGDEDARKLADLYASFMDESRLESLGARAARAHVCRHRWLVVQGARFRR